MVKVNELQVLTTLEQKGFFMYIYSLYIYTYTQDADSSKNIKFDDDMWPDEGSSSCFSGICGIYLSSMILEDSYRLRLDKRNCVSSIPAVTSCCSDT